MANLHQTKGALTTLQEVFTIPDSAIARDAAIHRFKYTFELVWKLFKKVVKIEGLEADSPRQALRVAFESNLFENIDLWFQFLEDRNRTSHTYNRQTANEVFESAKRFAELLPEVLENIEKKYSLI